MIRKGIRSTGTLWFSKRRWICSAFRDPGEIWQLKGGNQLRSCIRVQSIKKILKKEEPACKIIFPLILAVIIYNGFQKNSGL